MRGRLVALAMLCAAGLVQLLSLLPALTVQGVFLGALSVLTALFRVLVRRKCSWSRPCATVLLVLWAFGATFTYVVWRAEARLHDRLALSNENLVSRVELRVAGLPRIKSRSRQFEAEVLSSRPSGVPSRIMVNWGAKGYAGPYADEQGEVAQFPEIIPGQVWKMALILKTPHGARNPHGFDYEAYVFADGIRALGRVRGNPRYLRDEGWAGLAVSAQRARYYVRKAMLPFVENKPYGAVLLALTIGDQASVGANDWVIFNRSGITHLVSISGSHITMIAAVGGLAVFWLWRRLRWRGVGLSEYIPARMAAAVVALTIAWLYCLLAGWGVPARRTFLMLSVIGAAQFLRVPLSASRLLSAVAVIVVLLDPWAVLASGFWLSFGAVAILLASAAWWGRFLNNERGSRYQTVCRAAISITCLQMAITVGLMPALALIFHEVSVVSPLVNAYAIPIISFIVTPLALLLALFALLQVLVPAFAGLCFGISWFAHTAFNAMMQPTVWLAELPWASFTVAAAPISLTLLALLGIVLAIAPYGFPLRSMGWLLMLPALTWQPTRPAAGEWALYALDVGQGSALVVQTAEHVLLFDSGLRHSAQSDQGIRTIVPFLRALGERKLDIMIVSHADIDHAGGVRSVLENTKVEQSFSSFPLGRYLSIEAGRLKQPFLQENAPLAQSPCRYGTSWTMDGVTFSFLWPLKHNVSARARSKVRNAASCVLRIQGAYHAALLPGDIGKAQEDALVDRGMPRVDVMVAPHHGSGKSSTPAFVSASGARHVLTQVGLMNRYGHPAPQTVARWRREGARVWRSDRDGAVTVQSRQSGLVVQSERQLQRRYWQHTMPNVTPQ
ncbi:DNA internalization-related competence protein ComEC/Rec2 [Neopusillimonas maritima]|uniref:DNA internalization-related competence protein ComEC/Rec2 n=1 Tax=Neopusillimonas maritima TaxID=2026239 RepID=A0A3A1YN92_9BURK|nr:DNA internalization-related competence protein ComEC/Rec2 [Neopusillimonas maritima]RIY39622.1 DNA internalization-related competence protein ComEC/Rec2 [Neopusillimonas maritima]